MKFRHRLAIAATAVPVACSPASHNAELSTPQPKTAGPLPGEASDDEPAAPTARAGQGPAPTIAVATTTSTTVVVEDFTPAPVAEPVGDVEWLVRQTWPEDPDTAALIAWCESRFRPDAGFPSGPNLGVMQINWASHAARVARMGFTHDDLANPVINLAVARAIYDESGWRPWTCSR